MTRKYVKARRPTLDECIEINCKSQKFVEQIQFVRRYIRHRIKLMEELHDPEEWEREYKKFCKVTWKLFKTDFEGFEDYVENIIAFTKQQMNELLNDTAVYEFAKSGIKLAIDDYKVALKTNNTEMQSKFEQFFTDSEWVEKVWNKSGEEIIADCKNEVKRYEETVREFTQSGTGV